MIKILFVCHIGRPKIDFEYFLQSKCAANRGYEKNRRDYKNYKGNIACDSESKEMKFFDIDQLTSNQTDADLIEVYKNWRHKPSKISSN